MVLLTVACLLCPCGDCKAVCTCFERGESTGSAPITDLNSPKGHYTHLRPDFQHLPAPRYVQLRRLCCHTVIHCQHHTLPILCGTVSEVCADAEVVVLNTSTWDVLEPAAVQHQQGDAKSTTSMWPTHITAQWRCLPCLSQSLKRASYMCGPDGPSGQVNTELCQSDVCNLTATLHSNVHTSGGCYCLCATATVAPS